MRRDRGFTLVETIIAAAITLAVVASVFAMVNPAYGAFDTGLEAADMQQRLRVAVDALARDLTMAGAGAYAGGHLGPLNHYFAPVMPYRRGQAGDDLPGTFRSDVITIVSIPATAAQTTLAADFVPGELTLQAAPGPACSFGINLCGFAPGMTILVFDEAGSVDVFTVASIDDPSAQLTLAGWPADAGSTIYRRGSSVVEARVHTYYLKAGTSPRTFQLMRSDGSPGSGVPVVDHVVSLAFDYDGDPRAPKVTASGDTSYGPAPPGSGMQPTAYPVGENCAFRIDEATGRPSPRLPPLNPGAALTPLTAAQLTDGPWCPDETSDRRWDADLLRVRRIGVTIRIEAAPAALRGPAGVLFSNGGTSRDANRWLPDQEIRFHVSPRNLMLEP